MPKVTIYLPDELYRRAQERGLSLSAITQEAIVAALRRQQNVDWIHAVRSRKRRTGRVVDTTELMDEVREDFGR